MSMTRIRHGEKAPPGPERIPGQWAYLLAYALALAAALWQHGHAVLTLLLIAACAPAAFMPRLSYRRFPPLPRILAQAFILLVACGWGLYRLHLKTPPDLLLIESLGIVGFTFVFMTRIRDFRYLGLIVMVLLIYGAMFPREAYLWLLPGTLLVLLLLAYRNRTVGLTDDPAAATTDNAFLRNPGHILLHLVLVVALGIYLYSLFPAGGVTGEGLIPASFRTDRRSYAPPAMDRWFETPHRQSAADAASTAPDVAPTQLSPRGQQRVSAPSATMEIGNGGGEPGKELVMTVRCPMKLYWLCQLYDEYDGHAWHASEAMRRQSISSVGRLMAARAHIEQEFTIHRWHSKTLPSAYRGQFTLPGSSEQPIDTTFYNCQMLPEAPPPPLPFTYKVNSAMLVPVDTEIAAMAAGLDDLWEETLPPDHYRRLPEKHISSRIRALASALTRNAATPLEQALALRDYLRREYPYSMETEPPPADRETTDYFLFDLRRGHCEYFANALAVLARCRGLAARVATGYSPGDYDVLKQLFEVREYHAHAWTQVFIPGEGWLTLDATPPGEVPSRTTPTAFSRMHDPFGEDWRVPPPERATISRKVLRANTFIAIKNSIEKPRARDRDAVVSDLLSSIPSTEAEFRETMHQFQVAAATQSAIERWRNRLATLRANAAAFAQRLRDSGHALRRWLLSPQGIAILDLAFIAMVLWFARPLLVGEWRRRQRLRRCRALFAIVAAAHASEDPRRTIANCYRLTREWLDLFGHPRPPSLDLLDYGAALGHIDPTLKCDALVVFFLYSQFAYSDLSPSPDDARKVYAATADLRRKLFRLPEKKMA
jgi:transglutaminase-like putative cysteine protease